MRPPLEIINKTLKFSVGKIYFEPTYWQALAIVFLLFLLILTFARLRHMYVGWSFKGIGPSFVMGFVVAIIVEGFLLISGKTLLTGVLGWENAPKPIGTALDEGKSRLINVLGVESQPRDLSQKPPSVSELVVDFQKLSSDQKERVKFMICEPVK